MDGGFTEHYDAFNGEEEQLQYDEEHVRQQLSSARDGIDSFNGAGDGISTDDFQRDSSSRKLFVGGIAWETTEERFTSYFCKFGEITDSVIMMDRFSGRPRGFGFVTFADPAVADKVLEEDHVIDGRVVEVKRTVPREEMQVKGVQKTKKIFVGGIPPFLTEDELKEYFSFYGSVIEHQIMLDRNTGRSRGFGFVTFENEDAVERIFSDGKVHELGGKQVEIKKAVPKRAGGDYANDTRMHHGGSASKSYGGFSTGSAEYGGGYNGKMGRGGYGAYGGYAGYGNYSGTTMFEDSVSSSIPSIWASMNSWFTPPVLFVVLNLMIVTIAFTSSFVSQKQQQSHPQAQENPHQHHRMVRSPSVLERLKSINLYAYRSPEPHPSPPLAAAFSPAPDSATHYVSEQTHQPQSSEPATRLVFEEEEEEPKSLDEVYSQLGGHHFDRTRSETEPASGKMPERLPAKMRKSASAKSAFAHFEEEDIVEDRRPATVREGKAAAEVDDEVDAKADDFINKFKQQLKLQRLDSILGYKEMIARGSAK